MVHNSYVQETYGGSLADLRDEIDDTAEGWNIVEDTAEGGDLEHGDMFIIETPASDSGESEYLGVELEGDYGGVVLHHGRSTEGGEVNDLWDFAPTVTDELYEDYTVLPLSDRSVVENAEGDLVNPVPGSRRGSYWYTVVERGFGFYYQREASDGDDGDIFFGMCEVDKAWDYHDADSVESEWVLGFGSSAEDDQIISYMGNSGYVQEEDVSDDGEDPVYEDVHYYDGGNNTYQSRGIVNPDTEFDNYPVTNTVISSRQYRNMDQEDTIIGTFNLWGEDISAGDSSGHRDLIVDDEDEPVFVLLKRSSPPDIILRRE